MTETMRGTLSRKRILQAAMELADREGLEGLSMRRLALELRVEAASLYRHIANKEALFDGMVEALLAEIRMSANNEESTTSSWEDHVREMMRSYRRVAHRHPNVFPLLAARPIATDEALRTVERMLTLLHQAGLKEQEALYALRAVTSYALGYTLSEIRGFALSPEGDAAINLHTLASDQFSHIVTLAPHLQDVDLDAQFEFGVAIVLTGLREIRNKSLR